MRLFFADRLMKVQTQIADDIPHSIDFIFFDLSSFINITCC